MDYSLLGEVCELVADRGYYHRRKIFLFHNTIVPSIREKKFFVLRRDGKLIGFCNYGFMTREEIDEDFYKGDEVFSRNSGKILHFCTLVCESGPKDVLKFTRYIQDQISKLYRDEDLEISATRFYARGSRRLWKAGKSYRRL